jgi:hypothetical protein
MEKFERQRELRFAAPNGTPRYSHSTVDYPATTPRDCHPLRQTDSAAKPPFGMETENMQFGPFFTNIGAEFEPAINGKAIALRRFHEKSDSAVMRFEEKHIMGLSDASTPSLAKQNTKRAKTEQFFKTMYSLSNFLQFRLEFSLPVVATALKFRKACIAFQCSFFKSCNLFALLTNDQLRHGQLVLKERNSVDLSSFKEFIIIIIIIVALHSESLLLF